MNTQQFTLDLLRSKETRFVRLKARLRQHGWAHWLEGRAPYCRDITLLGERELMVTIPVGCVGRLRRIPFVEVQHESYYTV